jgi:hypothetical protein
MFKVIVRRGDISIRRENFRAKNEIRIRLILGLFQKRRNTLYYLLSVLLFFAIFCFLGGKFTFVILCRGYFLPLFIITAKNNKYTIRQ